MKENTFKRSSRLTFFAAVFAMLLAFAMLMPLKAHAATGGVVKSGTITNDDSNLSWKIVELADNSYELQLGDATQTQEYVGGTKTIPSEEAFIIQMDAWNGIGWATRVERQKAARNAYPYMEFADNITQAKFVGQVKAFGEVSYMFAGMENLKRITGLENFDTKRVYSMSSLFQYPAEYDAATNITTWSKCPNLKEFDFKKLNTSNMMSINGLFNGCALEEIDISGIDTGKVLNMSGLFRNNDSLRNVVMTGIDTSKVRYMNHMFDGCENLENLKQDMDTSNVITMQHLFASCKSLRYLNITNFNTENVADMSNMFFECESLTSLDVSKLNTANVIDMQLMFDGCINLKTLDVSNFETDKVENMSYMFGTWKPEPTYVMSLIEIKGLDNFDTSEVKNMHGMFMRCAYLKEIVGVDNWNTSKVINMRGMFADCAALESAEVLAIDTSSVLNADIMFKGCDNIGTKLDKMSKSDQYSNKTKTKLANASSAVDAITPAGTTTDQVKPQLAIIADALKDAAVEDARRALDAANDPEVIEKANNSSAATKKAYDDAKANLENLLADSNATAAQINAAVKALDDAVKDLTPKSDEEKAYDKAQKAAEDALKEAKDAKTAADGVAASKPGSDEAVKTAEEATAKAETAVAKANEAVAAAEKTGDQDKIDAAKALKAEAEKALADAAKLEAEQKIKRAENNSSEENKKAAQDAASKALEAAKKVYGDGSAEAQAAQALVDKANTLPVTGISKTFVVDNNTYRVDKEPDTTGDGDVTLILAKNAKSVKIPNTVTYEGKSYEVVRVGAKAFIAKKIRKVTLGANVEKIDKNAFKKSKVSTVVLKTKYLTKAKVKGSLKGSKVKTIKVKVGGSKKAKQKLIKKYKKFFTKANAGKKVTVK